MRILFKKNRIIIFATAILYVFTSIFFLLEIYATKLVVAIAGKEIEFSTYTIITIVSIFTFSYLFYYIKLKFLYRTYEKNRTFLNKSLFNKIIESNITKYRENIESTLILLNNKTEIVNQQYFEAIFQLIFSVIFLVGATIYIASINIILLVVSILFYCISYYISKKNGIKANKYQSLQLQALGNLVKTTKNILVNPYNVQMISSSKKNKIDFNVTPKAFARTTFSRNMIFEGNRIISETISNFREVAILLVILLLSMQLKVNTSDVFIVMYISTMMSEPFQLIGQLFVNIKSTKEIRENINDKLKEEFKCTGLNETIKDVERIEIKDISFVKDKREILKDASYCFENGKKYLIVGDSGSGKTTLIGLLTHQLSASSGKIMVNNKEVAEVQFRRHYAILDQDIDIFADTIANNITLYDTKYTISEVEERLQEFGLSLDLTKKISNDYSNLSGGEIQKIKLGRVLLNGRKLLFLDEAFSAVDANTAYEIEKMLLELPITLINVTHNINTELLPQYDYLLRVDNHTIKDI